MRDAIGEDDALVTRAKAFSCLAEAARVMQGACAPLISWDMKSDGLTARFLYPGVLEVVEPCSGRLLARSEAGDVLRVAAGFLPNAAPSLVARFQRDEARRRAAVLLARAACSSIPGHEMPLIRSLVRLSIGMCEISFLWPGVLEVASAWPHVRRRLLARSEPGRPDELSTEFAAALRAG